MKLLNVLVVAITMLAVSFVPIPTEAGPMGPADPDLTWEYRNNPSYFESAGSLGSNAAVKMDKRTLNVELYNPPHYIISVREITCSYPPGRAVEVHLERIARYYYNWDERKAYIQQKDDDGNLVWKELNNRGELRRTMFFADSAFKLAYNMEFYEDV